MREQIAADARRDGVDPARLTFTPSVRMQYFGMLDDLEVKADHLTGDPAADLQRLIDDFDELFSKVFARAARSPESGYFVTKAIGVGIYQTEKPVIPEYPESGPKPPSSSEKGIRRIYEAHGRADARLYEMDELLPGNVIEGPSIIESPATTFYIPTGTHSRLDRYRVFELFRG